MKRIIALLMSVAMIASIFTGCGSGNSESSTGAVGEGNVKDTLIIGTDVDINTLDLQKQTDQINNIVLKNTHQQLVFFTNEQTFEPGLATSWEFTDDTHIKFTLRDDVTFNDGTPMTAEDVKFTMDMALGKDSLVVNTLKGLVETKVLDDYTIEMTIEAYNNEFVQSLASVPLSIQSKNAYDSGVDQPYLVGTGPYVFE